MKNKFILITLAIFGILLGGYSLADNIMVEETFYERYGVSPEGLVLWLDQSDIRSYGDDSYWYDLSPKGNNGIQTIVANQPTIGNNAGLAGYSRQFDGTDDYVDCGNDESLDITEAITVEAWIKPNALPLSGTGSECMLVGKNVTTCGPYNFFIYQSKLALLSSNECNWNMAGDNSALSVGVWQHIAVSVVEGGTAYYYINGVNTDTKANWNFGTSTNDSLTIGKHKWETSFFNGTIDEVRIYNRALSAEEIKRMYLVGVQKHGGL